MKKMVVTFLMLSVTGWLSALEGGLVPDLFTRQWEKVVNSANEKLLIDQVNEKRQACNETAMYLIKQFAKTKDIMTKCRILFALGEPGSSAALSTLIENIELAAPVRRYTEMPLIYAYPAQQAILKFRTRAIIDLKTEILKTKDPSRRRICMELIMIIYREGTGYEEGVQMLKIVIDSLIAEEKDKQKKELLTSELNAFVAEWTKKLKNNT